MAQPYRIQDSGSGKQILPQSIQENTGVARNRFSRRRDRISRTTSSKNSGRGDIISFSVEETGETSMNSNEPASTVEEVIESSDNEKEKNNEQIQPENYTQNFVQPIYIDIVDDGETSMNNRESAPSIEVIELSDSEDQEELDYDTIEPNIMENQAEIRRKIHLYGQIRPQTEEEREYSPSPCEGFTIDLDKD
ncbi:9431_t:CDS:2 [Ambispora leptoticha]|uniref:9431_t:CDS:1 n=1 Tax=Ambispora leptoticha TaxID=144679 RepID=A0A9N9GSF9_9GLOM|nr:9431_t:CDS:2 [Ambispora leptoticha]